MTYLCRLPLIAVVLTSLRYRRGHDPALRIDCTIRSNLKTGSAAADPVALFPSLSIKGQKIQTIGTLQAVGQRVVGDIGVHDVVRFLPTARVFLPVNLFQN